MVDVVEQSTLSGVFPSLSTFVRLRVYSSISRSQLSLASQGTATDKRVLLCQRERRNICMERYDERKDLSKNYFTLLYRRQANNASLYNLCDQYYDERAINRDTEKGSVKTSR